MWKALIAGLFALVFAGSVQANAQSANPELESGISHFKSALRLTPEQHKHWPRVEFSVAVDGARECACRNRRRAASAWSAACAIASERSQRTRVPWAGSSLPPARW